MTGRTAPGFSLQNDIFRCNQFLFAYPSPPPPPQNAYNNMPIGDKVTHLLLALQTKTLNEEARQMAAVVLRRLFSSSFNEFYPNVSATLIQRHPLGPC